MHRWAYELTGGRIGGRLGSGVRAALLTTTGRKTGRSRTVPLVYTRDGAEYVFVASNNGRDRPPAWLLNAQAKPEVQMQIGPAHLLGTARVVPPGDPDYAGCGSWPTTATTAGTSATRPRPAGRSRVLVVTPA